MKPFLISLFLNSCLVNGLGLLFVTGLHTWNPSLIAVLPMFFYCIAIFVSRRPEPGIVERSIKTSLFICLSLMAGHLLEVALAFMATAAVGQVLAKVLEGGVEMMEMFFTNSVNSFTLGSILALLFSFLIVHFYLQKRVLPTSSASLTSGR